MKRGLRFNEGHVRILDHDVPAVIPDKPLGFAKPVVCGNGGNGDETWRRGQLVGLMGYAQSGKDTTAEILVTDYGYQRVAFADALREMAYALDPFIDIESNEFVPDCTRLSVMVDKFGWDYCKVKMPDVRRLLQRLGTEAGRMVLGEDIWTKTAMRKVVGDGNYVFTDVRFPQEADAIENAGGVLWRVLREGAGPVNDHPSETALDDRAVDVTIVNNWTLEDLVNLVRFTIDNARRLPVDAPQYEGAFPCAA